jgi:hypothetical protein
MECRLVRSYPTDEKYRPGDDKIFASFLIAKEAD